MALTRSLPTELLHGIIAIIQAERKDFFTVRDTTNYLKCTKALLNFAFASKAFRSSGIIHVYKTVILTSDNLPYFVRTILSSVELRPFVLDISLEFDTSGYMKTGSLNAWDHKAPARSVALQAKETFKTLEIPKELYRDFRVERPESLVIPLARYDSILSNKLQLGHVTHQAEASILLFLLPNLRLLRINTPEEEAVAGENGGEEGIFRCHFLRGTLDFAERVNHGESPESLPIALQNLQEFTFCDPYQEPGAIKSSYPAVLFWPLDWLSSVFHLPRIRKLTLTRASWEGEGNGSMVRNITKRSSAVEDLVFRSVRLHVDSLGEVLQIPKGLKSFDFEIADEFSLIDSDGDSYFSPTYISPSQLVSKLESHKETLESIDIRSVQSNSMSVLDHACELTFAEQSPTLTESEEDDCIFLKHAQEILPPLSLTAFSHLLKASFHSTDLLGIPFDPCRRLSDLLPNSLSHLTLRYDPLVPENQKSSFSEPFTHLFDLFADKDGGKVPNLKSMEMNIRKMWYMDFGVLDQLVKHAKDVGIDLSREWHDDVDYDPAISGATPQW